MIRPSNFHSIPKQTQRLAERHNTKDLNVVSCDIDIIIEPGVYKTSGDSELMASSVKIGRTENFLEIGCGSGIVSIAVSKRAGHGLAVDINDKAVANSKRNVEKHGIKNLEFLVSDVFDKVTGKFDVVICNPPYNNHEAKDNIDRMFWDPQDEMKRKFFEQVRNYLLPKGRIYFGWADFADIDADLPFRLASENGLELVNRFSQRHKDDFTFYVLEFSIK